MSWFWGADDMSARCERKGAAADEGARLHMHKNLDRNRNRVERHINLRGQTHVGQHNRSEAFQASHWGPTESHSCPRKQARSASDRHTQSRGGERRMGQEFDNLREPEHHQQPYWS